MLLSSCRYHAANVEPLSSECETHCAATHQRCVRQGEAVKWGLPGLTYDLCRRELETCRRDCRPLTSPMVTRDAPAPAPEGVSWEPASHLLSCARSSVRVTLSDSEAQAVRREGADAVSFDLVPARAALMRAGAKTSLLEDWAVLHARLTGAGDATWNAQLSAETVNGETVWRGEYEAAGAGRYRIYAREQARCRWLVLERASVSNR